MLAMHFDLRNQAVAGTVMADPYEAMVGMAEWADSHGGVTVALSEHHGSEDVSVVFPSGMISRHLETSEAAQPAEATP